MEELNKLIRRYKGIIAACKVTINANKNDKKYVEEQEDEITICDDFIANLETLRPHIRTEVDELKVKLADLYLELDKKFEEATTVGSTILYGEYQANRLVIMAKQREIESQIRSLEGGAL